MGSGEVSLFPLAKGKLESASVRGGKGAFIVSKSPYYYDGSLRLMRAPSNAELLDADIGTLSGYSGPIVITNKGAFSGTDLRELLTYSSVPRDFVDGRADYIDTLVLAGVGQSYVYSGAQRKSFTAYVKVMSGIPYAVTEYGLLDMNDGDTILPTFSQIFSVSKPSGNGGDAIAYQAAAFQKDSRLYAVIDVYIDRKYAGVMLPMTDGPCRVAGNGVPSSADGKVFIPVKVLCGGRVKTRVYAIEPRPLDSDEQASKQYYDNVIALGCNPERVRVVPIKSVCTEPELVIELPFEAELFLPTRSDRVSFVAKKDGLFLAISGGMAEAVVSELRVAVKSVELEEGGEVEEADVTEASSIAELTPVIL